MPKATIKLFDARETCRYLIELLRPACARINIAGSVRRCKPTVGDIELVAVPIVNDNLIGEPAGWPIDVVIRNNIDSGNFTELYGSCTEGTRCASFTIGTPPVQVHINIVKPDSFGLALAMRTGPSDFSIRLGTQKYKGGLLMDGYEIKGMSLWRTQDARELVPTPKERPFLERFCSGWIEPHLRR
jgi:DNA polymerase/3'-5' exonuclease PolX